MAKGNFSTIGKRKAKTDDIDAFVTGAKVDGSGTPPPSEGSLRRGKYYRDPHTGEKIMLGGKVQEIPLNSMEVEMLDRAASESGLSITTFMRSVAITAARKITSK